MSSSEIDGTILLFEYGSRAHGTNTVDSDRDMMGIFVEPKEYVTGILHMETQERKSAVKGARSTASDTDAVYYPLRKWAALAAKGNPTVLTALFAPEYEIKSLTGHYILENREAFISREAGERFLGYMISQRKAILGQRNKKTNRPELVHKYGIDTKFSYHMLRLGMQGIDLMRYGKIDLPMFEHDREYLLGVRSGKVSREEILKESYELEELLRSAIAGSPLPLTADVPRINSMLHEIYTETWRINA